MFNSIKQTVAFVTGGSSGLGLGTVKRLLEQNAKGIVAFDLQKPQFEHPNLLFIEGDVTKEDDVSKALAETYSKFGQINAVVNCAGIAIGCKIYDGKRNLKHPSDSFMKVLQVNTFGTFNVSKLAPEYLMKNSPGEHGTAGCIILTSSVASFEGQIGQVAYSASKGAINGMTLAIARDLSSLGIRCCTIAPGLFETPMMATLPEKVRVHLAKTVPCPQRLGLPEEYGHLVQSIIENNMLNGNIIRLDGALRMQP